MNDERSTSFRDLVMIKPIKIEETGGKSTHGQNVGRKGSDPNFSKEDIDKN